MFPNKIEASQFNNEKYWFLLFQIAMLRHDISIKWGKISNKIKARLLTLFDFRIRISVIPVFINYLEKRQTFANKYLFFQKYFKNWNSLPCFWNSQISLFVTNVIFLAQTPKQIYCFHQDRHCPRFLCISHISYEIRTKFKSSVPYFIQFYIFALSFIKICSILKKLVGVLSFH